MDSKPIIGYWHIRGLAQPIRLLLTYLGVEFEDRAYAEGGPPDFDGSSWTSVMNTLGLDFPNLPYLIDGDLKISESSVILDYLALKYRPEMAGETIKQQAEIYASRTCYEPNFAELKDQMIIDVSREVAVVAKYLGTKSFLYGEKITWPDFFLYEFLDMLEDLAPGTIGGINQNLVEYQSRVASLPNIPEYISRPKLPYHGNRAQWR